MLLCRVHVQRVNRFRVYTNKMYEYTKYIIDAAGLKLLKVEKKIKNLARF